MFSRQITFFSSKKMNLGTKKFSKSMLFLLRIQQLHVLYSTLFNFLQIMVLGSWIQAEINSKMQDNKKESTRMQEFHEKLKKEPFPGKEN